MSIQVSFWNHKFTFREDHDASVEVERSNQITFAITYDSDLTVEGKFAVLDDFINALNNSQVGNDTHVMYAAPSIEIDTFGIVQSANPSVHDVLMCPTDDTKLGLANAAKSYLETHYELFIDPSWYYASS